jgi:hypothetical protein
MSNDATGGMLIGQVGEQASKLLGLVQQTNLLAC